MNLTAIFSNLILNADTLNFLLAVGLPGLVFLAVRLGRRIYEHHYFSRAWGLTPIISLAYIGLYLTLGGCYLAQRLAIVTPGMLA